MSLAVQETCHVELHDARRSHAHEAQFATVRLKTYLASLDKALAFQLLVVRQGATGGGGGNPQEFLLETGPGLFNMYGPGDQTGRIHYVYYL